VSERLKIQIVSFPAKSLISSKAINKSKNIPKPKVEQIVEVVCAWVVLRRSEGVGPTFISNTKEFKEQTAIINERVFSDGRHKCFKFSMGFEIWLFLERRNLLIRMHIGT
jgi:hypothetical protein